MHRSRRLTLATLGIAGLLGIGTPALAATLATGVLETTNTTQIRCWLGNVSTQPPLSSSLLQKPLETKA